MSNIINYDNSEKALEDFYKHFEFSSTPLEAHVTVSQNHKTTFNNYLFVNVLGKAPNLIIKIAMNQKNSHYPDNCHSKYAIGNSKFAFIGNTTLLINSSDIFGNDIHLEITPK